MKDKGFTLVELLVMLVVLSILVGISIPNIMGIIKENKKSMFLDDANRLLDNAKVRTAVDEYDYLPKGTMWQCTILRLSVLDRNDDFKNSPNGGTYDRDNSFVLIKSIVSGSEIEYKYYVRLIEKIDDKYSGINFADSKDIEKKDKKVLDDEIENIGDGAYTYDSTFNGKYKVGDSYIDCYGIKDVK